MVLSVRGVVSPTVFFFISIVFLTGASVLCKFYGRILFFFILGAIGRSRFIGAQLQGDEWAPVVSQGTRKNGRMSRCEMYFLRLICFQIIFNYIKLSVNKFIQSEISPT